MFYVFIYEYFCRPVVLNFNLDDIWTFIKTKDLVILNTHKALL